MDYVYLPGIQDWTDTTPLSLGYYSNVLLLRMDYPLLYNWTTTRACLGYHSCKGENATTSTNPIRKLRLRTTPVSFDYLWGQSAKCSVMDPLPPPPQIVSLL